MNGVFFSQTFFLFLFFIQFKYSKTITKNIFMAKPLLLFSYVTIKNVLLFKSRINLFDKLLSKVCIFVFWLMEEKSVNIYCTRFAFFNSSFWGFGRCLGNWMGQKHMIVVKKRWKAHSMASSFKLNYENRFESLFYVEWRDFERYECWAAQQSSTNFHNLKSFFLFWKENL